MSAFKRVVRAAVLGALTRAFGATGEPLLREPLFRLIRRADDRSDSWTKALMKRTFEIEIGRLTYGAFKIDGSVAPGTRIGAFCSVAPGVRLGGSQHPTNHVSTHPFLYLRNRGFVATDDDRTRGEMNRLVVIEDDVWLGANALVMPGVTVGRGAVVGAGAVVTRDVEPYGVALGVPARVVAKRVSDAHAQALATVPWPRWDDDTIRQRLDDFYDVPTFLERYGPSAAP